MLEHNVDFALETTLSTRSYVQTIKRAQGKGYQVRLFYVWLESVEIAKERVVIRVANGGHGIPVDVIERNLVNLMLLYLPLCDNCLITNNSYGELQIVAEFSKGVASSVADEKAWLEIQHYGEK